MKDFDSDFLSRYIPGIIAWPIAGLIVACQLFIGLLLIILTCLAAGVLWIILPPASWMKVKAWWEAQS